MIIVEDILIADDIPDAAFACRVDLCRGACCTLPGGTGAPLEPDECEQLDAIVPLVRKSLSRKSRRLLDERGAWEELDPGLFVTTCVDERDCVFVVYEGKVAKCAIQKAWQEGRIDWPKPISCHLFPIRVGRFAGGQVLNYEQIQACEPGRAYGQHTDTLLVDFLAEPLRRKYGEDWVRSFQSACSSRRIPAGREERAPGTTREGR